MSEPFRLRHSFDYAHGKCARSGWLCGVCGKMSDRAKMDGLSSAIYVVLSIKYQSLDLGQVNTKLQCQNYFLISELPLLLFDHNNVIFKNHLLPLRPVPQARHR